MSVIKTATSQAVAIVISQFHQDVAKAAVHGMKQAATVAQKIQALITEQYKGISPTFEQYKADLRAFDTIAKERKLSDSQYLRRMYGAGLKALFEELPVSQAPDAVAKREQREQRDKIVKAAIAQAKAASSTPPAAPVGAPAGQTQEREPSEAEKLEQLVTRVGVFETLYACLRILECEESTKGACVHMRKMADKAKAEAAKADAAARLATIKPDPNALAQDSAKATLASVK